MPEVEISDGEWPARVVGLEGSTLTIGSDGDSAVIVLVDPTVSGVHALLERVGTTWLLRDLGSRNGTRVNGERLTGQRRLRHLDEIVVGRARLVFRDRTATRRRPTDSLAPPPSDLTRMERRTLVELCRPLLSHNAFQPPASVREIAARLYVGKNAVQAHLTSLYRKFGIHDGPDRRVALANEAMLRAAVTMVDLEATHGDASGHG
jgi:hypothetical protein